MSATTPRRPAMSPHHSPFKSGARRVLGDLTPRAVNTPTKQINRPGAFDSTRAQSPLKQVQTQSPLQPENKENAVAQDPHRASRKRSFHEVDGAGHVAHACRREMSGPAAKVRITVQMVDNLNAYANERGSSTEPDSPPPELIDDVPNTSQETNDSQKSFSNFVDWTECASQPTAEQAPTSAPAVRQPSKADLLRLRLSMATYKMKTNQTTKPASEIISTWETKLSLSTSISSSDTVTPEQSNVPSITVSPALQEEPVHVKANLDPGRPIPKLSMGPVLLPTAYSSRLVQDYNVPSSPPAGDLPQCVSPEQVMSPTRQEYRTPAARRIREEDYEDAEEDTADMTVQQRLRHQRERGDLTSSIVKGHAAELLLELNSGRR